MLAYGVWQAGVAQRVEQLICNQRVGGSNPFASSSPRERAFVCKVAVLRGRVSRTAAHSWGDSRAVKGSRLYICRRCASEVRILLSPPPTEARLRGAARFRGRTARTDGDRIINESEGRRRLRRGASCEVVPHPSRTQGTRDELRGRAAAFQGAGGGFQ